MGMDMLEIDCQLTKDKQVVVSHDNNVVRTTGEKVLISDTNYEVGKFIDGKKFKI